MISLSQLAIYPIKSTAQISLSATTIGPFGLLNDRKWMLIDDQGNMLTQRKYARMCLIHCAVEEKQLRISAPGMEDLLVNNALTTVNIKATVWEDHCNAIDCGENASNWFSHFLGISAKLVKFPQNEIRQVDLNFAKAGDKTAFSDGFPFLLISQASLDDLNSRLEEPVDMARFRPNIVVTGSDAFAEDNWKKIQIGETIFKLVKPCSRCTIPSIDPKTAEQSADVVKMLAHYRMQNNKIFFGQNVIAEGLGKLEIGMNIDVLE